MPDANWVGKTWRGWPMLLSSSFDEALHPRDAGGRFTEKGVAYGADVKDLLSGLHGRLAQPDGGFTVHARTGAEPTGPGHYGVSPYPARAKVIDVKDLSPVDLVRFIRANRDLLKKPHHFFGGWHDPETHKVYLDVSVVVTDPAEAAQLARDHQQVAYFDFGTGKSVRTEDSHGEG